MKPYAPLACALALVALPGCDELLSTTVTFTDEAGAAVELEFDLTGDCNDVGERTDELGVTRWTETTIGEGETAQCRIDVTWEGDLISLAAMRRDVVAECGADRDRCDPDTLDLSLEVRLDDAWFSAGAERMERAQLVAMTGRATTGDAVLFELDRTTALPLALGADPAVEAQLQAAYLAGGSLPVRAAGSLTLSMADVRRLQEGSPTGTLHVALTSTLSGSIDAHL
jgi:hypothetical protein